MRRDLFLIFSLLATNYFLYFLAPSNLKPQWLRIYWAPTSKSTEAKLIGTSATPAYPQGKQSDHTDKQFEPSPFAMWHTHTHTPQKPCGLQMAPCVEIASLSSASIPPLGSFPKHHLESLGHDKMNSSKMAPSQAFTLTSTKGEKEAV